jgi:microcystin-dependent protein
MANRNTYPYLPVGSILFSASNVEVPNTFLTCDGSSLDRDVYTDLFSIIGTTYGSVSATTFSLPDLITSPYINGGAVSSGVPTPAGVTASPFLLDTATIPSLAQANFTYGGWPSLQAQINAGVWFNNSTSTVQFVSLATNETVKANSSDVSTYSGNLPAGPFLGYVPPAQTEITPVPDAGSVVELTALTMVPIIKAWYNVSEAPDYVPLPVSTSAGIVSSATVDTKFVSNPTTIFNDVPALSGFIFEYPPAGFN